MVLYLFAGFHDTPAQYMSYGDIAPLLVEEDLGCPSVHYFQHERAPESIHRKNPMSISGFETTAVRDRWFEVHDRNHSAIDAPSMSTYSLFI
jgi:hypothetical protein